MVATTNLSGNYRFNLNSICNPFLNSAVKELTIFAGVLKIPHISRNPDSYNILEYPHHNRPVISDFWQRGSLFDSLLIVVKM